MKPWFGAQMSFSGSTTTNPHPSAGARHVAKDSRSDRFPSIAGGMHPPAVPSSAVAGDGESAARLKRATANAMLLNAASREHRFAGLARVNLFARCLIRFLLRPRGPTRGALAGLPSAIAFRGGNLLRRHGGQTGEWGLVAPLFRVPAERCRSLSLPQTKPRDHKQAWACQFRCRRL